MPLNEFELDSSKPVVLLLGSLTSDGIVGPLSAANRQYKQKMMESLPHNWETIIKLFDELTVREVLWKLTKRTYHILDSDKHDSVKARLLPLISSVQHIAFAHEELVDESRESEVPLADLWPADEEMYPIYYYRSGMPSNATKRRVHEMLREYNINLMPYATNAELTVMAADFISATEVGLLLRVYVPAGRMWSQETDRLLQLFRDYLGRVGKISVRLDQKRTELGVIYEFHSEEDVSAGSLPLEFDDFSNFMDLCASGSSQAYEFLTKKGLKSNEVEEILTRYSKEAKRLHVDLKHERERKLLSIRQRMESELVDVSEDTETIAAIGQLADAIIPNPASAGSAVALPEGLTRSSLFISSESPVTINLQPQIIEQVTGIVAREIRGEVNYSQNDRELTRLIEQHAGGQVAELTSCVHELGDASAPKSGRLVAKQKLKKFLFQLPEKATDVGLKILQKYVESQLGL